MHINSANGVRELDATAICVSRTWLAVKNVSHSLHGVCIASASAVRQFIGPTPDLIAENYRSWLAVFGLSHSVYRR
jgi:hypothetical protein